ncbi:MAG: hypothetical protein ACO1N7_12755 [Sphingobacteriaceae bacterium]
MQPISDKDLDKIFHAKLYSFEAEPSEAVWNSILSKISKKKSKLPLFWLAAASMATIVGTMIWFSSQNEPMKLTGNVGNDTDQPKKELIEVPAEKTTNISDQQLPKVSYQVVAPRRPKDNIKLEITRKAPVKTTSPAKVTVANVAPPKLKIVKEKPELEEKSVLEQSQTLAIVSETTIEPKTEPDLVEVPKKQRAIRSVGTLVNFVVGKVDKRKNKIIEFEDGDEGTAVSSLNLGLLKFQAKQ